MLVITWGGIAASSIYSARKEVQELLLDLQHSLTLFLHQYSEGINLLLQVIRLDLDVSVLVGRVQEI